MIAHRGASLEAPENTLASFRAALDAGAPAVEFDVHLSKDGVPVVIHDDTLERTTNGTGAVAERTLAQLRALDAGGGERVPTLAEVLDLLAHRALLDIELKTLDRPYPGLVDAVAAAVDKRGLRDSVVLSSFHEPTVREAKARGFASALIVPGEPLYDDVRAWAEFCDALGVAVWGLTPQAVRACAQAALPVYAWTVDEPEAARRLLAAGVAGVITNDPRAIVQALGA